MNTEEESGVTEPGFSRAEEGLHLRYRYGAVKWEEVLLQEWREIKGPQRTCGLWGDLVLFMYIYFRAEETSAESFSAAGNGRAREGEERTMHWSGIVVNCDAKHQAPEEVGGCHLEAAE